MYIGGKSCLSLDNVKAEHLSSDGSRATVTHWLIRAVWIFRNEVMDVGNFVLDIGNNFMGVCNVATNVGYPNVCVNYKFNLRRGDQER